MNLSERSISYNMPKSILARIVGLVGCLVILLAPGTVYALTSKVILTSGGSAELRDLIGSNLTRIVNSLADKNWDNIEILCEKRVGGLESIRNLVEMTSAKNVYPIYESKLINLVADAAIDPAPAYEVRDIKLKVDIKETRANPYKNTVFVFSKDGLLMEVRFAMEHHHYERMMKEGERLDDFRYREKIIQFLEIFRTAYNRYDLEYLKRVYSDDALIIVGRVLRPSLDSPDLLASGAIPKQRIEYIRQSKKQYIERLANIFKSNAFLEVQFEDINIRRNKNYPEVYGITLRQDWRASGGYHDNGYLFLLIDFRKLDEPLIRVRTWQPEEYEGKPLLEEDIITMDMFPIH